VRNTAPNGVKASIALEELKQSKQIGEYEVVAINTHDKAEPQKQPEYLKINPNGRIPALVDRSRNNFQIFESAAILLYLSEHYDKQNLFHFGDQPDRESEMLQWIFFQHGGLGPMMGQAFHFKMSSLPKEQTEYGAKRYLDETRRLASVYETRLASEGGRDYLVGDAKGKYSWADVVSYGWVKYLPVFGIDMTAEYPHLEKWLARVGERPAVKLGLEIPAKPAA